MTALNPPPPTAKVEDRHRAAAADALESMGERLTALAVRSNHVPGEYVPFVQSYATFEATLLADKDAEIERLRGEVGEMSLALTEADSKNEAQADAWNEAEARATLLIDRDAEIERLMGERDEARIKLKSARKTIREMDKQGTDLARFAVVVDGYCPLCRKTHHDEI